MKNNDSYNITLPMNNNPEIYVNNVTLRDTLYHCYISTNKNDNPSEDDIKNSDIVLMDGKINGNKVRDLYELNNDSLYIWIMERINTTYKILVKAQKVDRMKQNNLGQRIQAYFFDDHTATFVMEQANESRNIKYKIGLVTDNNVLKSIQKGESNSLSKLMEYAKNDKNGKTGKIPIGQSSTITSSLGLVNKSYYYVYMEVENDNGKYYPIEDVSLYQAWVSDKIGINLFDYLSKEFKWDIADDGNNSASKLPIQDPTTAKVPIPQTGETYIVISAISLVLVIAIISIIRYRKYRDIQ